MVTVNFFVFVRAVLGHLKEVQDCPPGWDDKDSSFRRCSIARWAIRAKDRALRCATPLRTVVGVSVETTFCSPTFMRHPVLQRCVERPLLLKRCLPNPRQRTGSGQKSRKFQGRPPKRKRGPSQGR